MATKLVKPTKCDDCSQERTDLEHIGFGCWSCSNCISWRVNSEFLHDSFSVGA